MWTMASLPPSITLAPVDEYFPPFSLSTWPHQRVLVSLLRPVEPDTCLDGDSWFPARDPRSFLSGAQRSIDSYALLPPSLLHCYHRPSRPQGGTQLLRASFDSSLDTLSEALSSRVGEASAAPGPTSKPKQTPQEITQHLNTSLRTSPHLTYIL